MNMKDLAQLLGLSRQTVSAVLNGKDWVSRETRERVLKAIREHNYAPNQHAISLTGKSTKLIGVVLRDISNPFYTQIALGIESVARNSGYSILYHNTFENHHYEVDAIRSLISFRVSGIIISPIQLGVDLSHLEHVTSLGLPIVSIDKLPNIKCHSISFADRQAAFEATSHLAEKGHTKIAFIKGPKSAATAEERLSGFLEAVKKHKLNIPKEWIIDPGTREEDRHQVIHELLGDPKKRPTAVFCFNDLLAVSVYQAAHDLELKIPQNLSVVGFDDITIAQLLGPPLTTVRTDAYKVGVEAAEMVLSDLQGEQTINKDIRYTPTLVSRNSVAPPARKKVRI